MSQASSQTSITPSLGKSVALWTLFILSALGLALDIVSIVLKFDIIVSIISLLLTFIGVVPIGILQVYHNFFMDLRKTLKVGLIVFLVILSIVSTGFSIYTLAFPHTITPPIQVQPTSTPSPSVIPTSVPVVQVSPPAVVPTTPATCQSGTGTITQIGNGNNGTINQCTK